MIGLPLFPANTNIVAIGSFMIKILLIYTFNFTVAILFDKLTMFDAILIGPPSSSVQ